MDKVKVSINDREYILSGDRTPEEIKEIASKVDSEMKKVARMAPGTSRTDAAILAALNLSEEIFASEQKEKKLEEEKAVKEEQETEKKIREYEEKIKELQGKVNEYENNFFDLQMENIKLKDEIERLK